MTAPQGRGRPPHPKPLKSSNFKLTEDDRQKLFALAAQFGKSRSEVIRQLIQTSDAPNPLAEKPDIPHPTLLAMEVQSWEPCRCVVVYENVGRYFVVTMEARVNKFGTWEWDADVETSERSPGRRKFTSAANMMTWLHGVDDALMWGAP